MKKQKSINIILQDWEAEAFKAGVKTQMTILAAPQPLLKGWNLMPWPHNPTGFAYVCDNAIKMAADRNWEDGNNMYLGSEINITAPEPFLAKKGEILYCKKHHIHLEVTEQLIVWKIDTFTDEDALNEGVGAIYPHSNVGDDYFYLPDQIIAASALDCFKHYWNNLPGNVEYQFDKNPFVITLGLKYKK